MLVSVVHPNLYLIHSIPIYLLIIQELRAYPQEFHMEFQLTDRYIQENRIYHHPAPLSCHFALNCRIYQWLTIGIRFEQVYNFVGNPEDSLYYQGPITWQVLFQHFPIRKPDYYSNNNVLCR